MKSQACHDTSFWEWAAEIWSWLSNFMDQSPKQIYSSLVFLWVKKTSKYFVSAKDCQLWVRFFFCLFFVCVVWVFFSFFPWKMGEKEKTLKITAKEEKFLFSSLWSTWGACCFPMTLYCIAPYALLLCFFVLLLYPDLNRDGVCFNLQGCARHIKLLLYFSWAATQMDSPGC